MTSFTYCQLFVPRWTLESTLWVFNIITTAMIGVQQLGPLHLVCRDVTCKSINTTHYTSVYRFKAQILIFSFRICVTIFFKHRGIITTNKP